MKINKYRDDLTVREGGKIKLSVAQVGEILKLVNADFGGALYFLIWLKGRKRWIVWLAVVFTSIAWIISVSACPTAVIEVRDADGRVIAKSEAKP